jgi:hypothetical protein
LWLAASCLAGVVIVLRNTSGLEGTEFSGGWLTGRLLSMADIGAVLFVLALVVTFWLRRIAEGLGLAASLLCLPLLLYVVAPVPFNEIFGFGHPLTAQPSGGFHRDPWAIAGLAVLAFTAYLCLRGLSRSRL